MSTICVFGDSIAWGAVDPQGGGWVTRLRNFYESESQRVDLDTDVYNLGVSGDNTDDLIKRFFVEMEAREPDTVIFAIGVNDSQFIRSEQNNRIALEKFTDNLRKMCSALKEKGKRIIVVGITRVDEAKTTPIPWNLDKEYRNEFIEKYDSALRELSNEFGATYVDVSNALKPEDLSDGLHPNSTGHVKLCEAVKAVLS